MTRKISSRTRMQGHEMQVRQNVTTHSKGAKLKRDFNITKSLPPS